MSNELGRVEGDLEVMRRAMGIERQPPVDSPTPHLLLALSGVLSIGVSWVLELMGASDRFPLVAALLIGVPPLLAMMAWTRIKARRAPGPAVPKPVRQRREFWWQMIGTAALVGVLVASGLSFISVPVIVTMLAVLAIALLNRPLVDHVEFSSIGWFVSLCVLALWILCKWPSPAPRGSVAGFTLILGGVLAAGIAMMSQKRSEQP